MTLAQILEVAEQRSSTAKEMLLAGATTRAIAEKLGVSIGTVRGYARMLGLSKRKLAVLEVADDDEAEDQEEEETDPRFRKDAPRCHCGLLLPCVGAHPSLAFYSRRDDGSNWI